MTSREENVLAARDPSIDDENDWQEFSLTDVKVLIPGKSRYANLLTASADNPVRVTGSLDEVEEEQESLVLDEDYLSKRIVIDNVTHYAYGQHDDGEVGIWVAGQAGWYSITPARGYRPVFNEMVEAIDLLYFLADRHQRRRGKRKNWNPTVEYLCDEYVNHTHGICEDGDDSAEVFYKHHSFLISQMLNPKEGVNWAETNIFEHLCEKFPEEYERIKSKSETKTNNEEEEQDGQVETAPHVHDAETLARNQADAIFKIILDLKEAGALAKRQLNLDLVASTLKDRFEIDTVEYAHDLITARATALIEMMDEARTTSFDWSRKAIYRELKSAVENSDAQHVAITPLRPRAPIEDESSDSESEPEDNARGRRRRVRKSVLRPKIASVSSKQVGKRTRAAAAQELEMSDDSDNPADDVQTPSKVRGHELVRDPLSTRAKRRTRSILSDTDSPSVDRTVKQESTQPDALSHAADESQISADPDNPEPETWVCPVQGCDKVIHKAGTKRSKQMIQDHSLGHAEDTQSKLELVLAEQRLNINLSVDNLISRIRGFGSVEPL
ncbi:hypothetical protein C8Q69DRAFT_474841 [Paecilomyces variotii]|uniref:RFTS domain-containing protein n=1 Tax=Byssochlamys spectabilis TaxID=264951 RepID=A0A443HPR3_BYSSP|nr:hypothetical protein C8Q69DRAFT_474841 [Paecilomyces variotii]KAJ9352484.1 hypothetical protein DTO280E4_7823 [Paecilomyces variotii]RWQ93779.1 hypothetical protein C8Q69DRAFT_474841 [Paecilomyces variotii]